MIVTISFGMCCIHFAKKDEEATVRVYVEEMEQVVEQEIEEIQKALRSSHFIMVRRRILRQLIESLIYEGIIEPKTSALKNGEELVTLEGRDQAGAAVWYVCRARRQFAFGRVRLTKEPVERMSGETAKEVECLATFLQEISPFFSEPAKKLSTFIEEVEQTLLKDTWAQYRRQLRARPRGELSYDELEGEVMDAHPYHPCYKSRIGFDLRDNMAYGPDFFPRIKLIWAALKKTSAQLSVSRSVEYEAMIKHELGDPQYSDFSEKVRSVGCDPAEYLPIPIHPWQWREKIQPLYFRQIKEKELILLGEGEDEYSPQQSIRTLANRTMPDKAYVKVPLSIVNTSAIRILGEHHVENAPPVSDWLDAILQEDAFLKDELRLVLLKEVVGISYRYEKLPGISQQRAYGTLAAIWRESLHPYLEQGEEAVPFTALCHIHADGRPFIQPWVEKYGVEQWVRSMLMASVLPMIHLLYAHGIGMESHAQNMVLIHREGEAARIALKDFPGGIRYFTGDNSGHHRLAGLKKPSAHHGNSASSMGTDKAWEVRDFMMDAFFHINLAEVSRFLEEHYGLSDQAFWTLVAKIIKDYQERFEHLGESYQLFDLFAEKIEVGQLTIRRLCGEAAKRDHIVKNPLHLAYEGKSLLFFK